MSSVDLKYITRESQKLALSDFKIFFFLALPILTGSVADITLSLVDTAIVGRLGASALAAIATGAAVYALLASILSALTIGYQVIIAQALGKDDKFEAGEIFANTSIILGIITSIFLVIIVFFPSIFVNILINDQDTKAIAGNYLAYRAPAIIFLVFTILLRSTFDSEKITKWGMYASVTANLVNIVLTFIFVYGIGDWSGIGAAGSGLAASVAAAFSLLFLFFVSKKSELFASMAVFKKKLSIPVMKRIMAISAPEVISAALDYFGNIVFLAIIAHISIQELAAGRIVYLITTVLFTIAFAVSRVAQINMGRAWGARNYADFIKSRYQGFIFSSIIVCLISLIPLLLPHLIMRLFTLDESVVNSGIPALIVIGLSGIFIALSQTSASYLRSVGLTKYVMISNVVSVWCVQIPLAWLLCYHFGLGLKGAYLAFAAYFLSRCVLALMFSRRISLSHFSGENNE